MNLAISFNKKYIEYAIVMLTSFLENNPEHNDIFVLHSELEEIDITFLKKSLNRYDVDIKELKINSDEEIWAELPVSVMWSRETYYRLLLPDFLGKAVDRILYLDIDIIVHGSVSGLYYSDFEGADIISVRDSNGTITLKHLSEKQQLMLKDRIGDDNPYFNAGVMLLNIKQIRKKYTFKNYIEAMREWNFEMSAFDQDILNYVHSGKIKYMSWEKYDLFAKFAYLDGWDYKKVSKENVIIHYTGDKPWSFDNYHFELEKFWWDYAALTPVYESLMKKFIEDAMTNTRLEKEVLRMINEKKQYEKALSEAEKIIHRLNG